ncbi:MAG: hypothetical protein IJZ73_01020 [Clostridia bacterium]|nr:hypothetical protein [Clostridia bacterium]
MTQQLSRMQEYLMKVLSTMDIKEENKVLISLELTKDKQIYTFLKWLKENMPEHKIKYCEREILRQVSIITKGEA